MVHLGTCNIEAAVKMILQNSCSCTAPSMFMGRTHSVACCSFIMQSSVSTCESDKAVDLQQAYVPILYEDLVGNPGAIGRLASPRGPRRGKLQQPFSPTSPKPMAFELRAQTRPKTIMQVFAAAGIHTSADSQHLQHLHSR